MKLKQLHMKTKARYSGL